MNWKLIFTLSLFGLAMALATVSLIPQHVEPICWLVIFIICAYLIVKNAPGKYFLHGFLVSMVNSVWITAAHVYWCTTYLANHPNMADMGKNMQIVPGHIRWSMLVMGPIFGVIFGLILGLFAFIAGKLMKKKPVSQQ
jgi:hypothetical protein